MNTGMKRFTKGCLVTALITFIVGGMLCTVGGLLGGFRQLAVSNIRGITGIPFRYSHNGDGIQYGFGGDDDWMEDANWAVYEKWERIEDTGGGVALNLTADTLRNLYIEAGACELFIKESQDDHVWLGLVGDGEDFRYHEEGGNTLRLIRRSDWAFFNWADGKVTTQTKVYLYLPKDVYLDYVEIEFGAGNLEAMNLEAREINMDIGAGVCQFDGITATDSLEVTAGAGQIAVKSMEANEADLEVGVGQIRVDSARIVKKADISVGMGEIQLYGTIQGDMDLECNVGNVTLRLEDREGDHNYEIDCSMGNVSIGNTTYTSLGDEKNIYNGSGSTFEIDCSMGNVNIIFAK